MEYTRLIKRYMSGADVTYVKKRLVELGYLKSALKAKFGNDSYRATRNFQKDKGLKVDGIVGPLTWEALFEEEVKSSEPESEVKSVEVDVEIPSHIGVVAAKAIKKELATVSDKRREIVLEGLNWAIDPNNSPKYLFAFYIRGGNLYNKDLTPNIMTETKLEKYFSRDSYKQYYNEGRDDMMREMCETYGYKMGGCDCSGFIVGLWREAKVQSSGFDATANRLYSTYCTKTTSPKPGDLAWRDGHIGLYVGGGYIAECIGGAYGLQITKADNRKAYNFQDKQLHKFSKWTAYGNPKAYE